MATLQLSWENLHDCIPHSVGSCRHRSVNGGHLPEVASPHILPKKGEIVHIECAASLRRRWRSASIKVA